MATACQPLNSVQISIMATPVFSYQDPFPLGPDDTEYRLLSTEGVSTTMFEG